MKRFWVARFPSRLFIECWHVMAGAKSFPDPVIPSPMPLSRRLLKKLPEIVDQEVASQAPERPIRLMFQDEARFGRINDPRRCWAPKGCRPEVGMQIVREYTYAFGAASPHDGVLDTLVLPVVTAETMSIFLAEVARRHPEEFILMFLDGAGWHRANNLVIPENMKLETLPPYSPNSTQWNTSGMRSGKSGSLMKSLKVWMA